MYKNHTRTGACTDWLNPIVESNTRIAQNITKNNKAVQKGGKFVKVVYLSCADIAEMTGVKLRTVWNWCKSGKLKASRPGGRDYMIKDSDLMEFLESDNRAKKTAGQGRGKEDGEPTKC